VDALSRGELAYLAGTSWFGTGSHARAQALQIKVQDRGWTTRVHRSSYEECTERNQPFLGHVQGPYLGHAVMVRQISLEGVRVVDPLDGLPRRLSRREFEGMWDGTVIEVIPAKPQ